MAAAPRSCVIAELGLVSPELVLVDPDLAVPARALLSDAVIAGVSEPARLMPRPRVTVPSRDPSTFGEESAATGDARRRLMDNAVVSESLGGLAPVRFRRRVTLIPSSSAASSVGILVLQLFLGHGHLG
jgi:hypothetical protein